LAVGNAFQGSYSPSDDHESLLVHPGDTSKGDRGRRINGAFGSDRFRIEIQGSSKHNFSVAFYQEDPSQAIVDQYMTETLAQKGRSRIEEFNRFLSDKLRGGKWTATCLRLTTLSDKDASIYRNFYKEFESKERIAMFKLNGDSGSKLFLVTPKFHSQVKRSGAVTLAHRTSTYAIVLTKKDEESVWID
jgi:hypothetical protein